MIVSRANKAQNYRVRIDLKEHKWILKKVEKFSKSKHRIVQCKERSHSMNQQESTAPKNMSIAKRKPAILPVSIPLKYINKVSKNRGDPKPSISRNNNSRNRSLPDLKPLITKLKKDSEYRDTLTNNIPRFKIKLNSADNTASVINTPEDPPSIGSLPTEVQIEPQMSPNSLKNMRKAWDANNNNNMGRHRLPAVHPARQRYRNGVHVVGSYSRPPPQKLNQATQTNKGVFLTNKEYEELIAKCATEPLPVQDEGVENKDSQEDAQPETHGEESPGTNVVADQPKQDDKVPEINQESINKIIAFSNQNKSMLNQKIIEKNKIVLEDFNKDLNGGTEGHDEPASSKQPTNAAATPVKILNNIPNLQRLPVEYRSVIPPKEMAEFIGYNQKSIYDRHDEDARSQMMHRHMQQYKNLSYQCQMLRVRGQVPETSYARSAMSDRQKIHYLSRRHTMPAQVPTPRQRPPISLPTHDPYYTHRFGYNTYISHHPRNLRQQIPNQQQVPQTGTSQYPNMSGNAMPQTITSQYPNVSGNAMPQTITSQYPNVSGNAVPHTITWQYASMSDNAVPGWSSGNQPNTEGPSSWP